MRLTRKDLFSLEQYAEIRPAFRARVMAHKRVRQVTVGPHVRLCFEDRLTMQYQIQEMLRAERLFEPEAIQDELDAYNPLIPDGSNWKATLLIEYTDTTERRTALACLRGIENRVWVQAAGCERVFAIADEDLERDDTFRTSAVHFLRFELGPTMIGALRSGAAITVGIDHPAYCHQTPMSPPVRAALVADLL